MTTENHTPVDPQDLLGLAEIANHFDVPYSTALSWSRIRSFPTPRRSFKMGPAWLASDIEEWRKTDNTRRRVR